MSAAAGAGMGRTRHERLVRALVAAVAVAVAPPLALYTWAFSMPLPDALDGARAEPVTRYLDRRGGVIAEVRAGSSGVAFGLPVRVVELPSHVRSAMLAAEDQRFDWHVGVDPLAVARAAAQAARAGKLVSGASTLTQQLARSLFARPRTAVGKLREVALALRIEASLSKDEILGAYLNRIEFGPSVRGLDAAARLYFDKPARDLSLAESALLVGVPRGPTLYDPRRDGGERALRRRDRILDRMQRFGFATADEVARAKAEPLTLQLGAAHAVTAPHLVRALATGALPGVARIGGGEPAPAPREVVTTLDGGLQRAAVAAVRASLARLEGARATSASVVVIENATGDVLAYVGSPGLDAELGHNDGALAARQPGSTLKPFVYALAADRLGLTAATLLPDVETALGDGAGVFAPRNYDGRFHGPVRAREALANSYNLPAVHLASRLGEASIVELLRALGFTSLDRDPSHYGAAIALGDGETRLVDLAAAYATLARAGEPVAPRFVRAIDGVEGRAASRAPRASTPPSARDARRPLSAAAIEFVTDVLADPRARLAAFGRPRALDLPFPVAVKTGTSKGRRDNLTVGFSSEVTVAVWVGNFDGSPMIGTSGVTGAAPIFRDVMLEAMRERAPRPLVATPRAEVSICALSGARAGPDCPHAARERFASAAGDACSMHRRVHVDDTNGLAAGPACADRRERVVEVYAPEYRAWARGAGRPVAPEMASPRCREGAVLAVARRDALDEGGEPPGARIDFPIDGTTFAIDPSLGAEQRVPIRLRVPGGLASVDLRVDGAPVAVTSHATASWPLARGDHEVVLRAHGRAAHRVTFHVD